MGRIRLTGATSGFTELRAANAAGNNTITLPTTNGGDVIVSDSSGNVNIDSGTFYVDASNNRVGIGNSSPSAALDVTGNSKTSTLQIGTNPAGVSIGVLGIPNQKRIYGRNAANSADVNILYIDGSNGMVFGPGDAAVIDSSGRLGIGTTPSQTFQVLSPTEVAGAFERSNADARVYVYGGVATANLGSDYTGQIGWAGTSNNYPFAIKTVGSERLRVDTSGRLLIGTSSARSFAWPGTAQFQVEGLNFTQASIGVCNNQATADPPSLNFLKSRGTSLGAFTVVSNGDSLGLIDFEGTDGSGRITAARITAEVDGTPGANDMPGRLSFSTTADGASSPTPRMTITSAGVIQLSNGSFSSSAGYGLSLDSTGTSGILARANSSVGAQLTNGATAWTPFTSESRLKNIVGDVDKRQAWDLISSIELKRYYYKDQDDQTGIPYIGPMADWLEQQDPELVIYNEPDKEGPVRTYNQAVLDMKSLAALQLALERIEQLEAKVAALESA